MQEQLGGGPAAPSAPQTAYCMVTHLAYTEHPRVPSEGSQCGWWERPVLRVNLQAVISESFACVSAPGPNQWLNYFVDACAASDVSLVKIVDKTKLDHVQKPN